MSYDLMVFDPDLAPARDEIADWYGSAMEAEAEKGDFAAGFDPASGGSDRLKAFYDDMRMTFPAMNGPDQTDDVDNPQTTGYEFCPGFIYMDFRWSAAEAGHSRVMTAARKHRLGLFDPQEDAVVLPGAKSGQKASQRGSWWSRLLGR